MNLLFIVSRLAFATSLGSFAISGCEPNPTSSKHEHESSHAKGHTYLALYGGSAQRVSYHDIDGWAVVEEDVVLGTVKQAEAIRQAVERKDGTLQPFGFGLSGTGARWKNKTVPYVINGDLSDGVKKRVKDAIDHWMTNTEIKFVERKDEKDFVTIKKAEPPCRTPMGRQGGEQFLWVGDHCTTGNIIHELGHTVGLIHEHKRPDRDTYVKVHLDNVKDECKSDYEKQESGGDKLDEYDHASIMHYPKTSQNCAKDPAKEVISSEKPIGQRDKLSEGDKAAVKKMYP